MHVLGNYWSFLPSLQYEPCIPLRQPRPIRHTGCLNYRASFNASLGYILSVLTPCTIHMAWKEEGSIPGTTSLYARKTLLCVLIDCSWRPSRKLLPPLWELKRHTFFTTVRYIFLWCIIAQWNVFQGVASSINFVGKLAEFFLSCTVSFQEKAILSLDVLVKNKLSTVH